jgi:hypothetical protein
VHASANNILGQMALARGDFNAARELLTDGEVLCRQSGDWYTLMVVLLGRGLCELTRGDIHGAELLVHESTRLGAMVGLWGMVMNHIALAATAALRGQAARAARLLGTVETLRARTGLNLILPAFSELREHARLVALDQLGPRTFERAVAEGRAMSPDMAVAEALAARAAP